MAEPFLAEIKIVGFNFAPRGWAFCDGQILPINQNQSLYSLLGTIYGGDGRTSFALPDLRSRTPIHVGNSNGQNHRQGSKSGEETHTLTAAEMPQHNHNVQATNDPATSLSPGTGVVLATTAGNTYGDLTSKVAMKANLISSAGGGQAHDNSQPSIALNFVIALRGLFPSRN